MVALLRHFVRSGLFCVGACFVFYTWDRGLTFTSARVLVRAPVDGPGSQPTDAEDHTSCVSRALVPTLTVLPPLVWRRQETRLSPVVRTCSKTWRFLRRLHNWEHRRLFDAVHVRKPRSKKLALTSHETYLSFVNVATHVFSPTGHHLHRSVTAAS